MLVGQLIFIQIATFVLIIVLLRWLFYNQISRALKRLQQLNQQNLEKERVLKEELKRAKQEVENEIKQGKAESETIKEQARSEAEKTRRGILETARTDAKRIISEGERESQRKHKELLVQIQDKAVYLAADIIRYIFTEESLKVLHVHLIDEFISCIEKLDKEKIRAQDGMGEIVCAYSLDKSQKQKLQKILSSKLDRDVTLEEKLDKEVVAGLILKLSGFAVIDGSVRNKFKRILPMVKEEARGSIDKQVK